MKYILTILILLLCGVLCFCFYLQGKTHNIAFIDTAYVFNNFKFTKESESKLNEIKTLRKNQLDSLYQVISQNKLSPEDQKAKQEEFFLMRRKFQEEEENLRLNLDNQIWNQINLYAKEYGEKNHFDIILGANGQGSIMHGNNELNISEEFTKYANESYNGK